MSITLDAFLNYEFSLIAQPTLELYASSITFQIDISCPTDCFGKTCNFIFVQKVNMRFSSPEDHIVVKDTRRTSPSA